MCSIFVSFFLYLGLTWVCNIWPKCGNGSWSWKEITKTFRKTTIFLSLSNCTLSLFSLHLRPLLFLLFLPPYWQLLLPYYRVDLPHYLNSCSPTMIFCAPPLLNRLLPSAFPFRSPIYPAWAFRVYSQYTSCSLHSVGLLLALAFRIVSFHHHFSQTFICPIFHFINTNFEWSCCRISVLLGAFALRSPKKIIKVCFTFLGALKGPYLLAFPVFVLKTR